jgi:hypothetical protein
MKTPLARFQEYFTSLAQVHRRSKVALPPDAGFAKKTFSLTYSVIFTANTARPLRKKLCGVRSWRFIF